MKYTITLFFLFMVFFGFSQTHKAIYSFKAEENPITKDTFLADEINPLAEHYEYYVYFNKDKSYYTSYNVENNRINVSDIAPETYYPKLYNFKEKKFTENIEMDKLYSYEYTNNVDWEITDESKVIDGYTCIKANGILKQVTDPSKTYKLEAWFTPEVAYPVGPYEYAGLPGIIVYLVFENYLIHKLESIKFNDNSLDINSIKYKGDQLTKEQYIEYLKS